MINEIIVWCHGFCRQIISRTGRKNVVRLKKFCWHTILRVTRTVVIWWHNLWRHIVCVMVGDVMIRWHNLCWRTICTLKASWTFLTCMQNLESTKLKSKNPSAGTSENDHMWENGWQENVYYVQAHLQEVWVVLSPLRMNPIWPDTLSLFPEEPSA